jgi:hypothetical protein
MTEGMLYVFSLPRGVDKVTVDRGIDGALRARKWGRVLGSGTSLADDGTVAIEIGAFDCDEAEDTISRVCRRLKCREFELVWD